MLFVACIDFSMKYAMMYGEICRKQGAIIMLKKHTICTLIIIGVILLVCVLISVHGNFDSADAAIGTTGSSIPEETSEPTTESSTFTPSSPSDAPSISPTDPSKDSHPEPTVPSTEPSQATDPEPTEPPATEPTESTPPETSHPKTEPDDTEPPEATTTPSTQPEHTDPPVTTEPPATTVPDVFVDNVVMTDPSISQEFDSMEGVLGPAQSIILHPEASGTRVKSNSRAVIDYSNFEDGYVMVKFVGTTDKRLKTQVTGPTTTYTYNLPVNEWTVFPLSDGNGSYKVKVFENISGNRYSSVLALSFSANLKDEFAPFIRPNQYVNFENAEKTIQTAAQITAGKKTLLEKVESVYNYVVKNISYDSAKAATVQSGYLPDLDAVLTTKKGICFDYASLMTGMLRSQGVPCKLVVGYAGDAYHAWISVWSEDSGWVDGVVYFNGISWQRMDPTFASSSNKDPSIMEYIGNGSNYTTKYIY